MSSSEPSGGPGGVGRRRLLPRPLALAHVLSAAVGPRGRFADVEPPPRPPSPREVLRWGLWEPLTGRRRPDAPGPPGPRVDPDLACIRDGRGPRLTWIGHASFLLQDRETSLLLDPVLSARLGPVYRRHQPAGLAVEQLPAIDAVLLTHNHYDHFDAPTLRRLAPGRAIVPAGLGAWLRRRGWEVEELAWWETATVGGAEVTFVPARHWSRRTPFDTNASLWGGFVVRLDGAVVYHAGDSGLWEGLAEVGRRFPRLDAALLPIGAYEPRWFLGYNHLTPEEAGRLFLALGARRLVPMHWGCFQLTDESLCAPRQRLEAWWERHDPGDDRELRPMAAGETLALGGPAR